VIAIWNLSDHEAVNAQIRAMPLYPYMSEIEVTPLIAHPKYSLISHSTPRSASCRRFVPGGSRPWRSEDRGHSM